MLNHAKTRVVISARAEQTLAEDVRQRHDIEACGLLLGHVDSDGSWHIERARPLRNIHNAPAYFEFAPEDLLEAELDHPGEIVGVYHSHPTGLRVASGTDRDNMRRVNVEQNIPWVWLIISGPFKLDNSQEKEKLSLIAYHHYHESGLQQIPIQLEGLERAYTTSGHIVRVVCVVTVVGVVGVVAVHRLMLWIKQLLCHGNPSLK